MNKPHTMKHQYTIKFYEHRGEWYANVVRMSPSLEREVRKYARVEIVPFSGKKLTLKGLPTSKESDGTFLLKIDMNRELFMTGVEGITKEY